MVCTRIVATPEIQPLVGLVDVCGDPLGNVHIRRRSGMETFCTAKKIDCVKFNFYHNFFYRSVVAVGWFEWFTNPTENRS